ncbi:glycosyltransferase family 4 protein [Butyrivibrio sp. MC2013]|uniref:glycosyltransferase family 4 protein n=1 Tax=Butyrivibrio sp. MC2013 TaxID=1280686 RepID=UPI00040BA151|nr:glycosyltransferase family 4 protein [Butyrivibrio sp. MC2013]
MINTFTSRILGLNISVSNIDEAVTLITDKVRELKGQTVVLITADLVMSALHDSKVAAFLNDAALLLPVDEPIAWIQRLRGFTISESVREKTLIRRVTHDLQEQGLEGTVEFVEYAKADAIKGASDKVRIVTGPPRSISGKVSFLAACLKDSAKGRDRAAGDKKDMLIYAHYYYPDVASTGQILTELAEGLNESLHITVICTVPSYTGKIDKRYKKHLYYYENINGVDVLRIRVPEFRKNYSASRLVNIMAYFIYAVAATTRTGHQDYIYTISQPPILGGLLGVIGKYLKKARLIYNIQDFNPEQVMAVSFSKNPAVLKLMMAMDKFSCKRADKIIVVGRDMIDTLKKRFPVNTPPYVHINNWINENEIVPLAPDHEKVMAFKKKYGIDGKYVIMYSGNIGLYYDLLEIQKIIREYDNVHDVVFAFVGQGSVLEQMQAYSKKEDQHNIVYIPYQNKEDLVYSLNAGDVHFVVNAKGIKGVSVPSKLYGVMAAGKPVLGILEEGSEARLIVEESGCGKVVEPGDYQAIRQLIGYYTEHRSDPKVAAMGERGRQYLDKNLTRNISIGKYASEILSL